ncbi:response regulator [Acidiferrimicrobium sp. IK]|uniref:response regulator transcription factor n=1 Tax=Acidiferrimicrobium sp. IK TaxID=2871700 RepID=UPI0021CB1681|nr:response regulator [Acidiferrimicrobium sp. IK]MCU4186988.1 response regulator [Acidiferrimicrobium sp. IK]
MARILVADDDPDIRELVALNLRIDGHHVDTAGDGEQALAKATTLRPDLLVLDVMMPGRDGFSVLEAIKADTQGLAEMPVILLTARSDRLDRIRGGIEGAVVYVTKPFSVAALRRQIYEVLRGEPEPELRLRAQRAALADLARVEAGTAAADGQPRPRLTRLEPQGPAYRPPPVESPIDLGLLSPRQREIALVVAAAASLPAAAGELGVSRTHIYASLRRMAEKLGLRNGPELARALRDSGASRG